MSPHPFTSDLLGTPAKNSFRCHDLSRHSDPPSLALKPSADRDRRNIMSDGNDTTIIMPIDVFQTKFLPKKNGFDDTFPEEKIQNISSRFKAGWEAAKKLDKKEKALTELWVSGFNPPYVVTPC